MLHWRQLLDQSNEQLAQLDVAEVNLACAAELPNAPGPEEIAECLSRLDQIAAAVPPYTRRRMPEFRRDPAFYDGSENLFRVVCLACVAEKFGVRYNPAKIPLEARFDPADVFIHGALLGDGGTCASLPVVYTAIGRRLGYPIKLVGAYRHQFCRWDEPGERFNIEAAGGVGTPSDDYFRQGRFALPPAVFEAGCYLKSRTPRLELASFLTERAIQFGQSGRHKEALDAIIWAGYVAPEKDLTQDYIRMELHLWSRKLEAMKPPAFPILEVRYPARRYPEAVPVQVERLGIYCEQLEECLTDPSYEEWWWGPLRRRERLRVRLPAKISVQVMK